MKFAKRTCEFNSAVSYNKIHSLLPRKQYINTSAIGITVSATIIVGPTLLPITPRHQFTKRTCMSAQLVTKSFIHPTRKKTYSSTHQFHRDNSQCHNYCWAHFVAHHTSTSVCKKNLHVSAVSLNHSFIQHERKHIHPHTHQFHKDNSQCRNHSWAHFVAHHTLTLVCKKNLWIHHTMLDYTKDSRIQHKIKNIYHQYTSAVWIAQRTALIAGPTLRPVTLWIILAEWSWTIAETRTPTTYHILWYELKFRLILKHVILELINKINCLPDEQSEGHALITSSTTERNNMTYNGLI